MTTNTRCTAEPVDWPLHDETVRRTRAALAEVGYGHLVFDLAHCTCGRTHIHHVRATTDDGVAALLRAVALAEHGDTRASCVPCFRAGRGPECRNGDCTQGEGR